MELHRFANQILLALFSIISMPHQLLADTALEKCWRSQSDALAKHYIHLSYSEQLNRFEHSFRPWQESKYELIGNAWFGQDKWHKIDTLRQGKWTFMRHSIQSNGSVQMMSQRAGKEPKLLNATPSQSEKNPMLMARYSPYLLVNQIHKKGTYREIPGKNSTAVVYDTISGVPVQLVIDRKMDCIRELRFLEYDDQFGNVETRIVYSNFIKVNNYAIGKTINIDKINGKLHDSVEINTCILVERWPSIELPDTAQDMEEETDSVAVEVEHFNNHIHFVNLYHTEEKTLLVEYDSFFLAAEAPLKSANGELIIAEAKRIAPEKPIRYFVFGHFHPHYTGGIRPFIHEGAQVISRESDLNYVEYLANADHFLQPDRQQRDPKPLKSLLIKDSMVISDATYSMIIYFIGEKSRHTEDYLMYYFPEEKLLYQDDLVWISRDKEITKAGSRQAGLYHAIVDLGLDVETVIQSWPIKSYNVKTTIPFSDLEKSVELME